MAVYHLTARIVTRSKGQSAVHKAAYNARTQLHDERLGLTTRDYSDEEAILFSGIFAPKDAPSWVQDREQLWNRVEAAEKRKDAQVAREIEVALPHELTAQQREWLVKDFVREQFVRHGMIADVAIHAPRRTGDQRNTHAHILLTKRELDGEAFSAKKNRDWDTKERLQGWRTAWSQTVNRHLERHGHEVTIDHRTLEAQGIDREPGLHLGVHAAAMEARGIETERGEQLRAIETRNRLKEEITELWHQTDGGRAFKAAVEERGYILAHGTLTDFCLVDEKGEVHGLPKQVVGVKADALRERMADIDPHSLPSVKEAKAIALERRSGMDEQNNLNPEESAFAEATARQAEKKQAIAKQEVEKVEVIGKQEQAKLEAIAKDEAQRKQNATDDQTRRDQYRKDEEAKATRAKELNDQQLQQQLDQQLGQLREMQQRRVQEDAYLSQRSREAEDAKRARQLEGDVTNPHGRYGQALGQHYDVRDPYGSLSRAAMAEHGAFMRERQNLDRQLAQEKDPEARKALELRKQIEGAEYMAVTDRRIASQSEIITGKMNSPEAVKSRERATAFEQEAKQLREQYREHQLAREKAALPPPAEKEKAEKTQAEKVPVTIEKSAFAEATAQQAAPPLMVADKSPYAPRASASAKASADMSGDRQNGSQPVPLTEFVKDLPERPPAQDAHQQRREQQRGYLALDDIGKAMKDGKPLAAEDVKNLHRRDLAQIKQKGDAHLRERVEQREQARSNPKTQGKELER